MKFYKYFVAIADDMYTFFGVLNLSYNRVDFAKAKDNIKIKICNFLSKRMTI